jgi:UMF1 family MFS transporter
MGYAGSVILQLIGFGLVLYFSAQGDQTSGPRYTFLLVGLWWMGFAQFTFAKLPNTKPPQTKRLKEVLQAGFSRVKKSVESAARFEFEMVFGRFLLLQYGCANGYVGGHFFGSHVLGLPTDKLIITSCIDSVGCYPWCHDYVLSIR